MSELCARNASSLGKGVHTGKEGEKISWGRMSESRSVAGDGAAHRASITPSEYVELLKVEIGHNPKYVKISSNPNS